MEFYKELITIFNEIEKQFSQSDLIVFISEDYNNLYIYLFDKIKRLIQKSAFFILNYLIAALKTSTLSSFSQGRSKSLRPKWPYAAVCL